MFKSVQKLIRLLAQFRFRRFLGLFWPIFDCFRGGHIRKSIGFLLLFALAYHLCDKVTWGFTLARLHTTYDLNLANHTDPTPYLHQKFYLRDQGGQSYVFFSEDDTLVLKVFKDMPRPWLIFPSYQKKKIGKLRRTLTGYTLAFEHIPTNTALLSLHLKPSSTPLMASLVDRLNITHTADLSSVYFVVQRKAEPLSSRPFDPAELQQLLGRLESAHLCDHDHRLHLNLGWVDDELVFLDPGRFAIR